MSGGGNRQGQGKPGSGEGPGYPSWKWRAARMKMIHKIDMKCAFPLQVMDK